MYARAIREARLAIAAVQSGETTLDGVSEYAVIGLFAMLHTKVYGIEPADLLEPNAMRGAVSAARRLVEQDFAGRLDVALEFVRWTWAKESRSFPGRTSDFRIGWRWQLMSKSALMDYRVALSKTKMI